MIIICLIRALLYINNRTNALLGAVIFFTVLSVPTVRTYHP
nr:MAG TPA: hypothetical protein [Caudoviricetes sp.]